MPQQQERPMSESFAELFEESLKTIEMNSGSIITGVITDIDNNTVGIIGCGFVGNELI